MRRALIIGLILLMAAVQAEAKSFVYSYRGMSTEDNAIHTCVGTLTDGKVTSKEAFVVDDIKMRRGVVGAVGDVVVFVRQGGVVDWLDLKTMKLTQVADDFRRPVYISQKEMVYLARLSEKDAPRSSAILKRCVFADGTCSTISDKVVLTQAPQQFAHGISEPLDVFWGIFLVDKKRVLGKVELSNGKFTSVAEIPDDAISNDISPDGSKVLFGVRDFDSAQGTAKGVSMAAKLILVDVATGESTVLARCLHQQAPSKGNIQPRFTALFADNDHVVYPETVIKGDGEAAYQRLVSMDLSDKKTREVGVINDTQRLINAVPLRTRAGDITWGEYKLLPGADKTEESDAAVTRGYSVSADSRLISGGKTIAYLIKGMPVWGAKKTAAFAGSLKKDDKPALYIYEVGSEGAVRVSPEGTRVVNVTYFE